MTKNSAKDRQNFCRTEARTEPKFWSLPTTHHNHQPPYPTHHNHQLITPHKPQPSVSHTHTPQQPALHTPQTTTISSPYPTHRNHQLPVPHAPQPPAPLTPHLINVFILSRDALETANISLSKLSEIHNTLIDGYNIKLKDKENKR